MDLFSAPMFILACAALSYLFYFVFLPTEIHQAFFGRWLPITRAGYPVYDNPWTIILFDRSRMKLLSVTLILLCCLAAWIRAQRIDRLQVEALGLGLLISFGTYLFQHKGWTYHSCPWWGFFLLLAIVMIVRLCEDPFPFMEEWQMRFPKLTAFAILVIVTGVALRTWKSGQDTLAVYRKNSEVSLQMASYIKDHSGPGETVVFLHTSVGPAFPCLIYAQRLSGSRYLTAFPISFFYKEATQRNDSNFLAARIRNPSPEEKRFLEELGGDILRNRPRFVVIQESVCQGCPANFRIPEYLNLNGWQNHFLRQYRASVDQPFPEYQIWKDSSACKRL